MKIQFIRWGGLSSVRQEGYQAISESFHTPPARRGIYAFVWPYIEPFLLGGTKMIPQYKQDEIDNIWTNKCFSAKAIKPKKFSYSGDIWCHLNIPGNKVLQHKNSWIKVTFETFKHYFFKETVRVKRQFYSKDHLEVFIEKV